VSAMVLKILLPFAVFSEESNVSRIVAESHQGFFGLLPHRLDCIAALPPGILIYETSTGGEIYVAVSEGVLIKTGANVLVSVRNAVKGTDLAQLRKTVVNDFLKVKERKENDHTVIAKLEGGFLRRLERLHHG
jgi:F-type H+-transporting ATPase subunit epsilon